LHQLVLLDAKHLRHALHDFARGGCAVLLPQHEFTHGRARALCE
jgi:hypothetical protein